MSTVELRGQSPKETVDVIDAVAFARKTDRMAVVNEILAGWAADRLHEAECIQRVTRSNPTSWNRSGK